MESYSKSDIFHLLIDRLQYTFPALHLQVHDDELILLSDSERVYISLDKDKTPIVASDHHHSYIVNAVMDEVRYTYNNFINEINI